MIHEPIIEPVPTVGREAPNFAQKRSDFQGDEVEEFWALRNVTFEVTCITRMSTNR